jgi:hypothetical protein
MGFCKWRPSYIASDKTMARLFQVENFLLVLEPFTEGIYKGHSTLLTLRLAGKLYDGLGVSISSNLGINLLSDSLAIFTQCSYSMSKTGQ